MNTLATIVVGLALSGCVGIGGGAMAGVSHSNRGRTRYAVDAPVGLHTRFYSAAQPNDRGKLFFFGLVPRATYEPGVGLGGGVGPGMGGEYFQGRWGVVGLATFGGVFDPGEHAGRRNGMRLSFRLQLGLGIEIGRSDWRIDESSPPPCGAASTAYIPRKRVHTLVGLVPGLEWLGSADGGAPSEWAVSVMASVRRVYEPGC